MSGECPFCDYDSKSIAKRVIYKNDGWVVFHAAPYWAEGHCIVSALKLKDDCPQELSDLDDKTQLETLGGTLRKVSNGIKNVYKDVEDVAIASLRGNIPHFHLHLIPVHKKEETVWRNCKGWKNGHLFEFLGDLERKGFTKAIEERIEKCIWDEEIQREQITSKLEELGVIETLRKKLGFMNG
ncbi:MAG: hypothetical protein PVJ36_02195 [Nitrospirota bacterium]|jgi:diadenosine tetraphosphate (Ap4A) HIT family hydrolase